MVLFEVQIQPTEETENSDDQVDIGNPVVTHPEEYQARNLNKETYDNEDLDQLKRRLGIGNLIAQYDEEEKQEDKYHKIIRI